MQRRIMTFAAGVSCLISASLLPADGFEPAFVAYKPKILVTPDNLPVMRWEQPGAETQIDLSALDQLALCTPGACPQEALDAGAVYYKVFGDLVAYYDQYGRLVGTAPYGQENLMADSSNSMMASASSSSFTPAGELKDIDQSLPGAMPGAFEVTPAGAATYSIPIEIPPGTAGVQPQLALSYNSQGGNGLLGVGWSISGLSAITRCPQTYAQDSNLTGLTFTSTDRFCLDGKRLMRTGGTAPYGADQSEYRTEIDSFSKVTAFGDEGGGPRWFQVRTKSGEIMQYGFSDDARIHAENHEAAGAWALNRVTDTVGNYFDIAYVNLQGEYRPSSIDYTGKGPRGPPARCHMHRSASPTKNVLIRPSASGRTRAWPRQRG